jgi:hypothetical protein
MKRCPTCQKTYDDAMRFCQTDGTALAEDAAPADPYKTMVASADDIASALRSPAGAGSTPLPDASAETRRSADDEPLQIPSEPLRAPGMGAEFKTRLAQPTERDEGQVMEIPPLVEASVVPEPEPPKFSDPTPTPPSFGSGTPPSPFSTPPKPRTQSLNEPRFDETTPSIPSPFKVSKPSFPEISIPPEVKPIEPAAPSYSKPEPAAELGSKPSSPKFAEPASSTPGFNPFEAQAAAPGESSMSQSEWSSPVGQNQPFNPRPAGAAPGKNQTLAIISLVSGILSVLCCFSIITGPIGAILGIMARGKASSNPNQYGGAGLALGGIILGIIGTLVGIGQLIYLILNFAYIMTQLR